MASSGGGGGGGGVGGSDSGSAISLNSDLCGLNDSNSSFAGGSSDSNTNAQEQQTFHQRCGRRITLSNGNRTATRSVRDFSHALVFSAEPLIDDVMFEVVIERKNHSWGGSIEIGVTSEPPDKLELPSCALALRNGTWVMSGTDVRKDGICLHQIYGLDLETLNENDRVGVMRTSRNELEFYVNGETQGVAAFNMPKILWALVDLYGRCVQVSICSGGSEHNGSTAEFDTFSTHTPPIMQNIEVPMSVDLNISGTYGSSYMGLHAEATPIYTSALHSSSNCSMSAIVPSVRSSMNTNIGDYEDISDRLRFHTRCGSLVKLSPNCRSAERRRPLDEFNNGVVMTHRPLKDNELFEIRIDKLVDKWSGSIEVGVTTHNPTVLHFPATMTNMRSGTIMMSGCGILTNGKGTRRQYGEFNLDELREGDRVGMMRKCNGNLHYYINGQDQGVAATRVSAILWGVIDLYGMTIKVTIVDRDEREQQNLVTRRNNLMSTASGMLGATANMNINSILNAVSGINAVTTTTPPPALSLLSPDSDCNIAVNAAMCNMAESSLNAAAGACSSTPRNDDRLTFHPKCGSHATVTHSGRTALRPNASDDFNNGVVLTRRPLRPNELFQVRLERVVPKWAGSVEMGVTTYSAEELDFPFTMTNVRSGTWMMTGNGVMHNGITVFEQYGQNLDRLQVGDRVGVVRKDDGTLHFWVNGIDQGQAASNVPERVYGVIDLYGQAAQASIVDTSECGSPDTGNSTISNTTLYSETPLRFHSVHGKNAGISNSGLTASRPNSLAEFNDAIVFSNRPLRQREVFEVVIETIVTHWSGNIEIGVTSIRPDEIKLAPNATDLDAPDTIVLCGPMIFHNRKTLRSNMVLDLDTLGSGARVGVMRNQDYIHFFVNGIDQGPACECRSPNIYAVVDLYGQCAQVSLTQSQPDIRAPYATSENSQSCQATSVIQPTTLETKHRWTCVSGNVTLTVNWTVASRITGAAAALSRCVVFSEHPLAVGSPFEIKIVSHNPLFAGCLNIGVTDLNLADENVRKNIPLSIKRIPANVWYLSGNEVRENQTLLHRAMASLEWLRVGDRIALELTQARTLRMYLNSEDMNIEFPNVPPDVYVVVELQGSTIAVQAISSQGPSSPLRPCSLRLQDSLDFGVDPLNKQDSMLESIDSEAQSYEFAELCGKNVRLNEDQRAAVRTQSYGNGMVFITKPLCKGESISVRVDAVNSKWKGTMGVGVVAAIPQAVNMPQLPASVLMLKRGCWVATSDFININGQKVASKYAECLEQIQEGTVITLSLTYAGALLITVNTTNLEELASGLPNNVYPVFDVYGKCEKISIITGQDAARNGTPIIEEQEAQEIPIDAPIEPETSVPQCEKADLEVHEKETDAAPAANAEVATVSTAVPPTTAAAPASGNPMNRSVMESVSENLFWNMAVQILVTEQNRTEASSSCCQLESLQLQHNTNLNIQRSQSTQRFQNALNTPTSAGAVALAAVCGEFSDNALSAHGSLASLATTSTSECIRDTNKDAEGDIQQPVTLAAHAAELVAASAAAGSAATTLLPTITTTSSTIMGTVVETTVVETLPNPTVGVPGMCNVVNVATARVPSGNGEDIDPIANCGTDGNATSSTRTLLDIITDYNNLYMLSPIDAALIDDDDDDEMAHELGIILDNAHGNNGSDIVDIDDEDEDDDEDDDEDEDDDDDDDDDDDNIQRTIGNRLLLLQQLQLQNDYLRNHHAALEPCATVAATAVGLPTCSAALSTQSYDCAMSLADTASTSGSQFNSLQQEAIVQFDTMGLLATLEPRVCTYFKLVEQFFATLVLPQSFFDRDLERLCFCTFCNAQALDKLTGWVYFKLDQQSVNATTAAGNAQLDNGDWVPLYYMTRVDKIRATLDYGQPLPLEANSENLAQNYSQKDEPGTRLELHYSPNSCNSVIINSHHHYRTHGQRYRIGTAFEVYVRRQSLCASNGLAQPNSSSASDVMSSPQDDEGDVDGDGEVAAGSQPVQSAATAATPATTTDGGEGTPNEPCCSSSNGNSLLTNFGFKSLSWFTKEAGACVITALVLKLEDCN